MSREKAIEDIMNDILNSIFIEFRSPVGLSTFVSSTIQINTTRF